MLWKFGGYITGLRYHRMFELHDIRVELLTLDLYSPVSTTMLTLIKYS